MSQSQSQSQKPKHFKCQQVMMVTPILYSKDENGNDVYEKNYFVYVTPKDFDDFLNQVSIWSYIETDHGMYSTMSVKITKAMNYGENSYKIRLSHNDKGVLMKRSVVFEQDNIVL